MASNNNIRTITMDELIAEAFQRLDLEDSRDELIFRNWIYRAIKWIGPGTPQIRSKCIDMCDLSFPKPCDYWSGLDANLIGSGEEIFYFQYSTKGFMNSESNKGTNASYLSTDATLSGGSTIKIGEDDNCFYLNSIASESGVSKMELVYYALPFDESGDPIIPENHVEAILAYLEWQWVKRARNRNRGTTNPYPLSEIEIARVNWSTYLGMVKGNAKLPSPLQAEAMMRKWVTGIPDFKNKARNSRSSRYKSRY